MHSREQVQFSLHDELGDRDYHGQLDIYCPVSDRCFVINQLPLESYVAGLLQAELSGSWPLEALKAQAIAGRSYAYAHQLQPRSLGKGQVIDYHLSDGGEDPSYRGSGPAAVKIDWAVEETRGQILSWQGHLLPPSFMRVPVVIPPATARSQLVAPNMICHSNR